MKYCIENNVLIGEGHRTGKIYCQQMSENEETHQIESFKKQMEYMEEDDYQRTLRPWQRDAVKQYDRQIVCPHCDTEKEPIIRKMSMSSGGLFGGSWMENVYTCQNCKNEFNFRDLSNARSNLFYKRDFAIQMEMEMDERMNNEAKK